ncbi:MAG: hypothetical protein V8R50_08590 [Clostridia bacterium]
MCKTEYGFFQDILYRISRMTITNAELMEKEIKEMTFLKASWNINADAKMCRRIETAYHLRLPWLTVVPCSFFTGIHGALLQQRSGERKSCHGEADPAVKNIQDHIQTVQNNMNHVSGSEGRPIFYREIVIRVSFEKIVWEVPYDEDPFRTGSY